jgi:PAS domain S-box-containing protein
MTNEKLQQVEAALRESDRRFHAVFNHTVQFMGLVEPNGTLISANQTALDLGGISSTEVIGRPFWEARWWTISPETQAQLLMAIARAKEGEFIRYNVDILGVGERIVTLDFSIKPIADSTGQVTLLMAEGREIADKQDLSEIRRLNAQLQEYVAISNRQKEELLLREEVVLSQIEAAQGQIQLYADIVKNMQIGLNVWHLEDPNDITTFRLVATNPAATAVAGISLENSIGKYIYECFPNILTENWADLELYSQIALGSKQKEQREIYYGDRRIEGAFFDVKVFPLGNRCVGLAFDNVTQRKQTEQALQESEERFRTMADTAPVMIWVSGTDKLFTYFNHVWLEFTGRTLEQELGNGWLTDVHPEDFEDCLGTYTNAFDAREAFMMEYRLKRFDGEYCWVLDKGTPRFNADNSFAGYIGSCIDISVLKERTEELTRLTTILAQTTGLLQKRNLELDQFAYVASHDLKAPLRAIASLSEWMEEDLAEQLPPENLHQMKLLRGRVHRLEGLINGLLAYSRVGRIETASEMVDVEALLHVIIDLLAPPPAFTINIEPGMPTFIAKRSPLEQVFSNLISNAIKHHSRLDGHIKISVKDKGKYYEFAVSDDGSGIAPEYHEKVFVIFQTLEARDKKENTGIGLAIVKKIVEAEGGTITLESQVGAGCTFRFTWHK